MHSKITQDVPAEITISHHGIQKSLCILYNKLKIPTVPFFFFFFFESCVVIFQSKTFTVSLRIPHYQKLDVWEVTVVLM